MTSNGYNPRGQMVKLPLFLLDSFHRCINALSLTPGNSLEFKNNMGKKSTEKLRGLPTPGDRGYHALKSFLYNSCDLSSPHSPQVAN